MPSKIEEHDARIKKLEKDVIVENTTRNKITIIYYVGVMIISILDVLDENIDTVIPEGPAQNLITGVIQSVITGLLLIIPYIFGNFQIKFM